MFQRLRRGRKRKLLIIGLDCVGADLLFHDLRSQLPHISGLMRQGTWGQLNSCIPCITIPAWSSMLSGRDPGVLGLYGFRNRSQYDYEEMTLADSHAVKQKRIWDYVAAAGGESLVVNVPQTWIPPSINGSLISGFLTPGREAPFAYPAILKNQVLKLAPDYRFDVSHYRGANREGLLQNIIDLTVDQYRVFRQLLSSRSWDFAIHVNIASDRLHHVFWRYHDAQHRLHEPGHKFANTIRDYYQLLDEQIGSLLSCLSGDEIIMLVSDHGVKRMDGAVCINEWLWRNGWLTFLKDPPARQISAFNLNNVDWLRTKVWSTGGYCGRFFFNVLGREPAGIVPPNALNSLREELGEGLQSIADDRGNILPATIYEPSAIYQQVNGIAPDLIAYFGDLHWRVTGSLGNGKVIVHENDTGPDDANHAMEGFYILVDPLRSGAGKSSTCQIMDVASTALRLMNLDVPKVLQGKLMTGSA